MKDFLFDEIIEVIRKYDGLTKKSTEKLINFLIKNPDRQKEILEVISKLDQINICSICNYYTMNNKCIICENENRNKKIICIVATQLDGKNIEKLEKYQGVYHILNAEINLSKNITPDDLNLDKLISRVEKDSEIILALNATFEGEVTSNYIYQLLKGKTKKISRLAKESFMRNKNMFITLEGMDGSGKSTVILSLEKYLKSLGYKVLITREPGGHQFSEKIRNIVLGNETRKEHVDKIIKPKLEEGYIVISDRFMDSTSAYQGNGRQIGIEKVDEIQNIVLEGYKPDLTLYFDVEPKNAQSRLDKRVENKNRLDREQDEFKAKVYEGYHKLIALYPKRIKLSGKDEMKLLDLQTNLKKLYLDNKLFSSIIVESKDDEDSQKLVAEVTRLLYCKNNSFDNDGCLNCSRISDKKIFDLIEVGDGYTKNEFEALIKQEDRAKYFIQAETFKKMDKSKLINLIEESYNRTILKKLYLDNKLFSSIIVESKDDEDSQKLVAEVTRLLYCKNNSFDNDGCLNCSRISDKKIFDLIEVGDGYTSITKQEVQEIITKMSLTSLEDNKNKVYIINGIENLKQKHQTHF
ncbi:hypothetical protein FQA39_LY13030 [Lamprigera yunnana]|nr:hypothetical protein FQA39_LY13030 [Lamprigera yunnana]